MVLLGAQSISAMEAALATQGKNLGGADVVLTADDLSQIEAALARIKVEGDLYPAAWSAMVDK